MGQAQGKDFPFSVDEKLSSAPNDLWSFHSGKSQVCRVLHDVLMLNDE